MSSDILAIQKALDVISTSSHHKVLHRVPEYSQIETEATDFTVAIVDLETTGLVATKCEIIEIGIIQVALTRDWEFRGITSVYNALQQPTKGIPDRITEITGITDRDVEGQTIDWGHVCKLMKGVKAVICHNASFDRKFLEAQTPAQVRDKFAGMRFGCTKADIDWAMRGYGANKLDYLNWQLGYFYDAHRAVNDCWATLNLLIKEPGALRELLNTAGGITYTIQLYNSPYWLKEKIKELGFYWDGKLTSWSKDTKTAESIEDIKAQVKRLSQSIQIKVVENSAKTRYSSRSN